MPGKSSTNLSAAVTAVTSPAASAPENWPTPLLPAVVSLFSLFLSPFVQTLIPVFVLWSTTDKPMTKSDANIIFWWSPPRTGPPRPPLLLSHSLRLLFSSVNTIVSAKRLISLRASLQLPHLEITFFLFLFFLFIRRLAPLSVLHITAYIQSPVFGNTQLLRCNNSALLICLTFCFV